MNHKENIILFNIAGITIKVDAGFLAINNTNSTAAGFAEQNTNSQPQYQASLEVANAQTESFDNQEFSAAESFEGETEEFDWTLKTLQHKELIFIDFKNHPTWRRVEMIIEGRFINIMHYPVSIHQPKIDFYLYPLTNLLISRLLHHQNGVMVHSSGVMDNGKGYIFTAVSGTGKSTMAGLWKQKGATVINDDIIAITTTNKIAIHNIPMPYYQDVSREAPLNAIFIISQSPHNYIRPLNGAKAAMMLMANCIQQFGSGSYIRKHLETISLITKHTPVYELGFKPDTEIVDMIRHEIG